MARLYTGRRVVPWRCSVPLTTTRRARNRSQCPPPLATLTSRREAASTGRRALQSGRQGRCWREGSGWTLRGRREPRRAVAVGIWGAGLLSSADHSEWTACQIPSRPSYRASFVLRRWPAARLGDWWNGSRNLRLRSTQTRDRGGIVGNGESVPGNLGYYPTFMHVPRSPVWSG